MSPSRSSKDQNKKDRRKARRRELEQLVRSLRTENERLKADGQATAMHSKSSSTIPRPHGSAGDGFNLRDSMGLAENARLYRSIQRTVRALVNNAGLDHRAVWRQQPKETVVKLFRVARKRQPYLRRFTNDWATEEFAKQYLKNRRAYCRRKGLDEDIDLDPGQDDSDLQHIDDASLDDELYDGNSRSGSPDEDGSEDGEPDDKGEGPSGLSHDDD